MNMSLLRCCAILLLAGCGLCWAAPAHAANINCMASMTNLSFGAVDPQSSQTTANATLAYTCTNSANQTYSATLCFSIGEPAGGPTNPRQMTDGAGHFLTFQLYSNSTYSTVWGSQFFGSPTPLSVNVTIAKNGTTGARTATLYGRVDNGQTTAIPGSYTDKYLNGDTALTINEVQGNAAPGTCSGVQANVFFPFTASAAVAKQCTVTAGPVLNLGAISGVDSTDTNITGSNTLNVTCTSGTVYNIGLMPQSTNSTTGAGSMAGTGGNTDKVPYQLRSTAGLNGTVWGNTATPTSVGNGVTGSGNGNGQSLTVYATAPGANYTPDTYTDTVIVYVYY